MSQGGTLFVISSPSGGGKTTVCRELLKRLPKLIHSVSYTTRPRRPGEVHGRDYFFVSEEEFDELMERGELAEWTSIHGHRYGTPARFLKESLTQGLDVVLALDIQGANNLKKAYPETVTIFLLPPSKAELKERLRARNTDDLSIIGERLNSARMEVNQALTYDYAIINEELEKTTAQLGAIITSERLRSSRASKEVMACLKSFEEG